MPDQFSNSPLHLQFAASTNNIVPIYHLISSILPFGKNCLLTITHTGLLFSINDNNICKVTLTLDKRLFSSYEFNPIKITSTRNDIDLNDVSATETEVSDTDDEVDDNNDKATTRKKNENDDKNDDGYLPVNLDLKSFLETINIHLSHEKDAPEARIKCILSYQGDGYPFLLTFEDDYIIEKCELHTLMIEERERENMRVIKKKSKQGGSGAGFTEEELEDEGYDNEFIDSSIFQIDISKVIFDIVLKSTVLYDASKDMNDLNTAEFIIYCSNENDTSRNTRDHKNKKVVFISRSSEEAMGFSKIVIPTRATFLRRLEIYEPENRVLDSTSDNDYNIDTVDFLINGDNQRKPHREPVEVTEMIPKSTNVSSFYDFSYFAKITKALKLAKSVKIRKDSNGLTSFSMLIDPVPLFGNSNILQGTNIEFVTLETVAIEDRLAPVNSYDGDNQFLESAINKDLLKYGYHNQSIKQMIKDDENIRTIRITGDGQLTTIDDFFKPASEERSVGSPPLGPRSPTLSPPLHPFTDNHESSATAPKDGSAEGKQGLQMSEALARSVLGYAPQASSSSIDANRVDVNATVEEVQPHAAADVEENNNDGKKRKGRKLGAGSKKSKKKKKNNNDIKTVGGAIEIPLFI